MRYPPAKPPNFTAAICCHNGAQRLAPTLAHLRAQIVPSEIEWEVLFIDNASTDGSAELARALWSDGPAPLRIVHEPELGLSNARERVRKEAKFEIIGLLDDDTWVCDRWVAVAAQAMASAPALGVVAPLIYPAFEAPPPRWWYDYANYFAILLSAPTTPLRYLNCGGAAIRKSAWDGLRGDGFQWRMVGREGKKLSCGEDNELTFALRLAGWKLRIEPRLRLIHFIEAHRVTWPYMRRMVRGYAASWVLLDSVFAAAEGRQLPARFREAWQRQALSKVKSLLLHPRRLSRWAVSGVEGDPEVIETEREIGRLIGLLTFRSEFTRLMREARERGSAKPT